MSSLILSAETAMLMAIAEAQKGWGRTSPNPLVGCVIVDSENKLIASGHHIYANKGPHAEVAALNKIDDKTKLKGATVYLTLEPCSHHTSNKKAPCAEVLAQYPLRKVIYGLKDPNPLVSGGGEKILRDAGIEAVSVAESGLEDLKKLLVELEEVTEHFLTNMRTQMPFIALKVATTADGYMADNDGPTQWITGETSRQHVHYLRAGFDAILVGKNTFMKDNPKLNVRHPQFSDKKLKVLVADSKGEALPLLKKSEMYKSHKAEDIYWIVDKPEDFKSYAHLGIHFVAGPVNEALKNFHKQGVGSVFVEGGAEIYTYFIKNSLVDRLYHYVSSDKFKGRNGLHWLKEFSKENPLKFKHTVRESMGRDSLFSSRVDKH